MTRRTPVPGQMLEEQARQLAKRDGQRAAAWVAAYLKSHGHGPRSSELALAMGWDSNLAWPVIGRLQNRGDLLWAALTIWRHWDARSRPKANISFGSFERWAQCVGGALELVGLPGFLSNTAGWLDTTDDDTAEWAEHLERLHAIFGETKFTALDVAKLSGAGEIEIPWFKRESDVPIYKALGYKYRSIKDRTLGGHRLAHCGISHGRTRWAVTQREGAPQ